MADVLLARSDGIEGFERHVVIKRIRPELARDDRFIRMFLDEARVVATLHHQHIVQVHDIGEAGGEYFLAMEYVHGEDTRTLLATAAKQRTHVPLGCVLPIVSAAASGLHHAHERRGADRRSLNIVHRDVSPSNILIGYDGAIKLVDFGIATTSMVQETRSGSLKGKLSYMSPEQCKGAPVDRRTDIYALGVVLYELATTTRMIRGQNDYQVMDQIVHGRISPPQSRRPDLPDELSDIIMRALATERTDRYASADELRAALDAFAAHAGLTSSNSSIATYMRQQFGAPPEPWLDLSGELEGGLASLPALGEQSGSRNAWADHARSRSGSRNTSSLPMQSGQIGVLSNHAASTAPSRPTPPPMTAPVPVDALPAERAGWNQPPPAPRGTAMWKLGLIAAVPLAAAVWLGIEWTRSGSTPIAVAPVVPPAPIVTAILPAASAPAPAPDAATAGAAVSTGSDPVTAHPAVTVRPSSDPAARKARSPSTAAARTAQPTVAEAAPVKLRAERPSGAAAGSAEPSARNGTSELGTLGGGDSEAHRAVVPPPPVAAPIAPPPVAAPVVPPPPPVAAAPVNAAPSAPQQVAPGALESRRLSGERNIILDGTIMGSITRAGIDKLVSIVKVCVTADGAIASAEQMKNSGFPAYDDGIRATIRNSWKFRPYVVNGTPTPVCTALRFVWLK